MKGDSVTVGYWRGKPIEEFTKDELIEIVVEMHQMMRANSKTHQDDLRILEGLPRRRSL